ANGVVDVRVRPRLAETAVTHQLPDEVPVLHEDRPVGPELMVDRPQLRLGDRGALAAIHPQACGVERNRLEDQERGEGQCKERRGARQDPTHDEADQRTPSGSSARRTPSAKSAKAKTVEKTATAGQMLVQLDVTHAGSVPTG